MDAACLSDDVVAAYLGGELSGDSRRSVDTHIDGCGRCRRIVSALAAVDDGPQHDNRELVPGRRLRRFELRRRLGEGAMSVVWAAHDPELDREVAIKVLHLQPGATRSAERLRREAQAMARLNHPNVVKIHELDAEDGRVFCAMEIVDGVTLRAWLATPRPWHEIVRALLEAGRGIAAAHAVGLIHRDIKPDNILIATDGRTLVSDFGLAKLAAEPQAGGVPDPEERSIAATIDSALPSGVLRAPAEPGLAMDEAPATAGAHGMTASGALIGTPAYMAPEQLERAHAGAPADQFAFCVTAFEALFGVRPFAGDSISSQMHAIREGELQPVTRRDVPAGVVACLARGLAAEPAKRWPAMPRLLEVLARAADEPRRRRRWIVAIAGVVALGTGAGVLATRTRYDRAAVAAAAAERIDRAWSPERAAALQRAFVATGAPVAAERAAAAITAFDAYRAEWLSARVNAWAATHARDEQTPELLELRIACFERLAEVLGGLADTLSRPTPTDVARAPQLAFALEPVATCANVARLRATSPAPSTPAGREAERTLRELELLQILGRHREVRAKAEALLVDAERRGDPMQVARARFAVGSAQANTGAFVEAEATLRQAVLDAAAARDHYLVAEIWLRLHTLVGLDLARPSDAATIEPAVRSAVAQAGDDPRQRADLAYTLGLVEYRRGNFKRALDHVLDARARHAAVGGPEHPTVANAETMLGALRMHLGELDESERHLTHAIAIVAKTFGARHPMVASAEHNLMSIAARRKDWPASEHHGRTAVQINTAVKGSDHLDTARARTQLARALRHQRKLQEARSELELAQAAFAEKLPAHPDRVLVNIGFAQIAETAGDHAEAVRLGAEVLARLRAVEDVPRPQLAFVLAEVARFTAHEHPAAALPLYDEALTIHVANAQRDEGGDVETLEEVARAALAAKRPAAALRWFDAMPKAAAALPALRAELAAKR